MTLRRYAEQAEGNKNEWEAAGEVSHSAGSTAAVGKDVNRYEPDSEEPRHYTTPSKGAVSRAVLGHGLPVRSAEFRARSASERGVA